MTVNFENESDQEKEEHRKYTKNLKIYCEVSLFLRVEGSLLCADFAPPPPAPISPTLYPTH